MPGLCGLPSSISSLQYLVHVTWRKAISSHRTGPILSLARSKLRLCLANHRAGYFALSKLRLCSANHRPGYWSNLPCDWPSTAWAYSEQETENGPWSSTAISTMIHNLTACHISIWSWDSVYIKGGGQALTAVHMHLHVYSPSIQIHFTNNFPIIIYISFHALILNSWGDRYKFCMDSSAVVSCGKKCVNPIARKEMQLCQDDFAISFKIRQKLLSVKWASRAVCPASVNWSLFV